MSDRSMSSSWVFVAILWMVWAIHLAAQSPTAAAASPEAARHRDIGIARLAGGDPKGALESFRAAIALDPNDGVSHDGVGVIAGDAGQIDVAIAQFRRAIQLAPHYAPARFHLALAMERTGKLQEAVTEYQHALRLDPALVEARYGLSSVCAKLGDLDGAIALLRHVVKEMPQFAEAHFNLGLNLWNRYKRATTTRDTAWLVEAEQELQIAVQSSPETPHFHAALGQLRAETQKLTAAVESLAKARALAPSNHEYAYNHGLALRLAGDLDAAEAQFRAALKGDPRHASARRSLGLVLRQKGDLAGAEAELREVVVQAPEDAQAHHLLGSVLAKLNRPEAAREAFERALEIDPYLTEARAMLAQALARAGNQEAAQREQSHLERINAENAGLSRALILIENAAKSTNDGEQRQRIEQLREATGLAPSFAEAHFQLGLALQRSAETAAEAEDAFRKVLALDQNRAEAHYRLGLLLSKRGDTAGALTALRKAVELSPGLVEAQRELAALAWNERDWPAVLGALRAVVAWDPGDAMAHIALGRAYREAGELLEAAREFEIAERLNPALKGKK